MIRAAGSPYLYQSVAVPRRADPPGAFLAFFGRRRLGGSISPAVVDSVAGAIQSQEGYYPGSRSYRNNNPGNLIYAGQPGASRDADGFAVFSSYAAGDSALKNQITLDATRGTDAAGRSINTLSDLISSWAPSSDPRNNTPAYISSVVSQTGYAADAPLSSLGTPDYSITVYLPAGDGPGGLSSSSSAPGSAGALPVDYAYDPVGGGTATGFDPGGAVDLSAVGLPSSVPLWWIGAGLVGALVLSRAF